jgi:hypothetical protein
MKKSKHLAAALLCLSACALRAQTTSTSTADQTATPKQTTSRRPASGTAELLRLLKQQNEALQRQMNQMREQMEQVQRQAKDRDQQLQQAKEAAAAAQATAAQAIQQAENAQKSAGQSTEVAASLQGAVSELKTNTSAMAATIQQEQKSAAKAPDSIRFKGIELKPGGFLAAETVYRRRGIGGDVNTQFSGIPFAGQTAGLLSEFNASGRQSRFSLLAEGKLTHATLRGYYEADFLSAGVTSNDNQSNSYTLRQRQVWAQSQLNDGVTVTGGQMWSLATEYKSGVTNRSEATPLTIDAQYNVGFSWERQYGFRVAKEFHRKLWVAGSIEAPETLNIGGHNLPTLVYQQAGNGGGLYNSTANYSFNRFPDLVGKLVYEPGFGHYEVFAIGRFFRDRVYPNASASTPSAAGAFTSKVDGGGIGGNARASLFAKKLDAGVHFLGGAGVGRYSTSTLPDVTAHPDGSLEALRSGSALGSLEWHPSPRWDLYGYYGGEYAGRAYYLNPSGKLTGYGAPTNVMTGCHVEVLPVASPNGGGNVPGSAANCTADTRNIQEGTLGAWYRFYKGDKGTLQAGFQYSYVSRHTWIGVGGSPKAIDPMWFSSFRYYLPQ